VRHRTTTALAALALAVAAAGCGGSSSAPDTAGASSDATTTIAASSPTAGAATVKTATSSLGTFLVDGRGRTLYLWQADRGDASTCDGACVQAWPPLTTAGAPSAAGGVHAVWLGTSKRDDGTTQVTYAGHPLYRFAGDGTPGETTGQGDPGFGAPWYVVDAEGKAITG
jgi:predicted lipoprotein with Yx(FWY)xxD motif